MIMTLRAMVMMLLERFFYLFWKTRLLCVSDGDSARGGPGDAKNMGFGS